MSEKKYTKDHEWIKIENEIGTVGITNNAQEQLGDIVFFELPELNKKVKKGEQVGVVESVKAASELYTPVSGEIIEINNNLTQTPDLVNKDPEDSGWYMKIKLDDISESENLMSLEQYNQMIKS
tara:strand:+ start:3036 stop:3407 length:372 start_codon:yes stop_codon:yes gene_type:complete